MTKAQIQYCERSLKENHGSCVRWKAEEVQVAIREMKNAKKRSEDGIAAEDMKMLDKVGLTSLCDIYNDYCLPESPEQEWTKMTTWLIPKMEGCDKVKKFETGGMHEPHVQAFVKDDIGKD